MLPHYAGGESGMRAAAQKGAILFHKREWPPLDPPREREGRAPRPPNIAGLGLEELLSLRNQVRCTWLRHESLRFGTDCNRALLS